MSLEPLDPNGPPFIVRETAVRLRMSDWSVYEAVKRGEIRALRLGRSLRIPQAEVARLLGVGDGEAQPASPATTDDPQPARPEPT